jgi:hypothetical protein
MVTGALRMCVGSMNPRLRARPRVSRTGVIHR